MQYVGGPSLSDRLHAGQRPFATACVCVSYGVLVMLSLFRKLPTAPVHHHILFLIGLLTIAVIISYQVQRVRALSRFYERRPQRN